MSYIELHAASAFSFLQGASLPEALVERAAALGYPAIALLDRDGVYGAPRFHKAARAAGIRPIIAPELSITNSEVTKQNSELRTQKPERRTAKSELRRQNAATPFKCSVVCELSVLLDKFAVVLRKFS